MQTPEGVDHAACAGSGFLQTCEQGGSCRYPWGLESHFSASQLVSCAQGLPPLREPILVPDIPPLWPLLPHQAPSPPSHAMQLHQQALCFLAVPMRKWPDFELPLTRVSKLHWSSCAHLSPSAVALDGLPGLSQGSRNRRGPAAWQGLGGSARLPALGSGPSFYWFRLQTPGSPSSAWSLVGLVLAAPSLPSLLGVGLTWPSMSFPALLDA
jgi:hypothetical protein